MNPLNQCGACGEDFTSVETFDRHRVGEHEHRFSTAHPEGRRCLSGDEVLAKGWQWDDKGRWFDPVRTARARVHFAATQEAA